MLPNINKLPTYQTTIPSSQTKVSFRPFLTKEQKILLIALESQDEKQILDAIIQTLKACYQDLDYQSLTTFDVEYLFTQLRSKSVGEKSKIALPCENCGHENQIEVDLEKISVDVPNEANMDIALTSQYTLRMKYPNYSFMMENAHLTNTESFTNVLMELMIACMDSLRTEEEKISFADEKHDDIVTFIDNLTSEQLEKIMEFMKSIPKLKHDVDFNCSKCQHENKYTLEGIADFF